MVFGFDHNSVVTLYDKKFYRNSCIMNAACMVVAAVILPFPGKVYGAAATLVFLGFLAEILLRGDALTRAAMRNRYIFKMVSGMVTIGIGTALVDKEYVLYVPAVMGMLYLNVNTLLRSPYLQKVIYGFMFLSVAQSVGMHHADLRETLEYGATSVFLVVSALLTFGLFRSNKDVFERNERRASILLAVGRMQNELMVHDVNNALMSIFVLSNERYRSDKALFVEELERRLEEVRDLLDVRMLDRREDVDLGELLDRMPAAAGDCRVVRDFQDRDPIPANLNMFYSMLRNFLQNSAEAAARSGKSATIHVRKSGRLVVLEDDAGGFDTSLIRAGATSKSQAGTHGVFLRTVSDPVVQAGFGYRLEIERTQTGTRVEIDFGGQDGAIGGEKGIG